MWLLKFPLHSQTKNSFSSPLPQIGERSHVYRRILKLLTTSPSPPALAGDAGPEMPLQFLLPLGIPGDKESE
ncbi:unnamed protein product [Cuscuta campestris]|uniref:Uncharacterized protein n=1 Tax=Cuscuta campestris TaxID=132261 RepID=A0A484NFJ5_9ASTE|nr:unnamed protein product [Cuscuta campestris]